MSYRRGSRLITILQKNLKPLRQDKLFIIGASIISIMVFISIFAPWISPYPAQGEGETVPSECPSISPAGVCPPSLQHPLGTEVGGRDLLSRIFFGIRTSILISVGVVMLALAIGLLIGLTAGFFGGFIDEALMRITDIFLAIPHIILALNIVAILGPGLYDVFIALGVTWWPAFARLARAQAISIRSKPYVMVARASGISSARIVFSHILPNSISPLLVQMSIDLGAVVLAEAGLSFIGLGVRPPTADLGQIIYQAINYITTSWWMAVFPGLFLTLLVLGFNMVGDAIRDRFDPSLRRQY
ncbi:MAG: ABC transporter permease [Conexivisphaerales archaeon]